MAPHGIYAHFWHWPNILQAGAHMICELYYNLKVFYYGLSIGGGNMDQQAYLDE